MGKDSVYRGNGRENSGILLVNLNLKYYYEMPSFDGYI